MKISKNKSKGKVHPSPINPSSSSCCSFSTCKDASSTLKLLPVTILTLISVLSPDEREVFAYMITRSIKATSSPRSLLEDSLARKSSSSLRKSASSSAVPHVPPVFDCGCFECYTSYWYRWDSSPNRELIHQAIEAFEEEHLSSVGGDQQQQQKKSSSSSGGRGKTRRGRVSCCPGEYSTAPSGDAETHHREIVEVMSVAGHLGEFSPGREVGSYPVGEKGVVDGEGCGGDGLYAMQDRVEDEVKEMELQKEEEAETVAGQRTAGGGGGGGNHNKGLARKVLPDVIGLFNSRMWSLWSPNV